MIATTRRSVPPGIAEETCCNPSLFAVAGDRRAPWRNKAKRTLSRGFPRRQGRWNGSTGCRTGKTSGRPAGDRSLDHLLCTLDDPVFNGGVSVLQQHGLPLLAVDVSEEFPDGRRERLAALGEFLGG